ncbi:c-type cytochrome [Terasakiella pusilla]|uniref:c-type cytochrome n=1 Tax=Terasakiella pusilla TaxID=64973 RepID=UPI003AA8E4C4
MAPSRYLPVLVALLILPASAAQATGDQKGKELYVKHCAPCHGANGEGDGVVAAHLSPPPADLAQALKTELVSDEYLMWTIREGGRNVHTGMPSFEETAQINEADAQAIVRYLWETFK